MVERTGQGTTLIESLVRGLPAVLADEPRRQVSTLAATVAAAAGGARLEELRGYRALDWVATVWAEGISRPAETFPRQPDRIGAGPIVDAESAARVAAAAAAGAKRGAMNEMLSRSPLDGFTDRSPSWRAVEVASRTVVDVVCRLAVPNRAAEAIELGGSVARPASARPDELWDVGQDVIWAALPDALRVLGVWSPLQVWAERGVRNAARDLARTAATAIVEAWDDCWLRTGSRTAAWTAAEHAAKAAIAPPRSGVMAVYRRDHVPPGGVRAAIRRRTASATERQDVALTLTRTAVAARFTAVVARLQTGIVELVRELAELR